MIVVAGEAGLRLVTQSDHAQFAARLLGLWRGDDLRLAPRREEILFAVREHDNGWREADSAARVDGTGRPLDFRDAPLGLRAEVWLRGVARHADSRPYAARLIAEHALEVHRERAGNGWPEFLASLAAASRELDERLGNASPSVAEDYGYLEWADAAALTAAGVWPSFETRLGKGRLEGGAIKLYPFPFAGVTTFSMACREVHDRPYVGAVDLASTLAESRWSEVRVRALPW